MAIIQSGAGSTLWTIDPSSSAGRVTVYNQNGIAMGVVSSLSNILNAINSATTIILGGQATLGINVTGTTGTLTLSFEASMDNIAWFALPATSLNGEGTVNSTNADGYWIASTSGFYAVRTRISSYTSGSMNVSINLTPGASQNISQSVTGIITTNIGTTGGLSLDATLTGGTQTTRLTDGTNTASVKAASTTAGATDKALVVAISPNNSVAVTGTFFQTTQPVSGTVTANIGTTNGLALDATLAKLTIAQSTALGSNTQAMVAGSVTTAAPTYTTGNINPLSLTTAGALRIDGSGTTQPVSGTVTANAGSGSFTVVQATAANLNATVTGAVAATQSGTWTVQPGNTANTTPWLSTINQGGNSATVSAGGALKTDSSATTQPVSGTITANAGTGSFTVAQATAANLNATVVGTVTSNVGTTGGLALDATLTGGTARNKITDGTNNAAVKAASTAAGATDPALVVAISPNNSVAVTGTFFQATQPVSGTFFQATQPVSGTVTANAGTGNFTVAQATAANLNATVVGTVTSNIGTTNGLALDATVAKLTIAQSTALGSNTQTLMGGSVTTAAPTYTTGNINPLSLTTAGALRVDASATTQPISGTVTANAGTGSFTVAQATAANLNATVVGSGNFTIVQPTAANLNATVTGTVTSNQGTANTNANGWFTRVTDGTNNVTVKAASTQAAASDVGLVVSLNPTSAQTKASTATVAQIASSVASVTLLAANANRLGAIIVNDSTQILFLKFGTTASSTSYSAPVAISKGTFEVPFGYTGIITGSWVSANGFAYCTELTS